MSPGAAGDAVGGGWFGYLSYPDAGADGRGPRIPEAAGGWSDCVLRQDRDGHWWYESLSGAPLSGWVAEALRHTGRARPCDIRGRERTAMRTAAACWSAWRRSPRARSTRRVCARSSPAGSTVRRSTSSPTPSSAPPPRVAAYLAGEWGAVASLSPELFLRRRGDAVTSSPIKGTLPRHADPAALRASVKDVAENIMIVDLVRNDLGRVAVTGSVTVPELLAVRPAPGVWHLVSTVSARVDVERADGRRARRDVPARIGDRHPEDAGPRTAARLGAASPRSLLRHSRFGITGGGVRAQRGDPDGGVRRDGNAVLGVGGGITADSDPDREWDECLHKAAPIIDIDRAALHEYLRQPFRLADHQVVAGVHRRMMVWTPPSASMLARLFSAARCVRSRASGSRSAARRRACRAGTTFSTESVAIPA